MKEYEKCNLCPRKCNINRKIQLGYCGMSDKIFVARIAPHYWEEPCISGTNGSGAIFFSGCNLKCVYCQNNDIAHGFGAEMTICELADAMLRLENSGCHNINLVTASHYTPSVIQALETAKQKGLSIPIVYNCSGYESIDTLKMLSGYIDIYLPDFKYIDKDIALKYSNAPDYPEIAKNALHEMYSQVGKPLLSEDGMMKKGIIVRVLALPSCDENTKSVLKYLKSEFNNKVYISLMSQYTPMKNIGCNYPELGRKITEDEYEELCGYAKGLRLNNLYFQDGEAASESFIPEFNLEGVKK